MPVYEVKSFRYPTSPYEDKGPPGAFKFGSNLNPRKIVDSISCGQALEDEGLHSSRSPSLSVSPSASVSRSPSPSASRSISPTPSPSASQSPSVSVSKSPSPTPSASTSPSPSPSAGAGVSTIFQGLIHWFVKATDGYTYAFDNVGFIYRRDSDGVWVQVYKDPNGAILGAAEWYSSSKKTFLYWATRNQLNRKELPGLANWNDVNTTGSGTWPKTNLETADWHTMREAGGSLIIANREFLALVGYDDSYTNEAVNLIPGNIVKTIVERNGRTIAGTGRPSDPNKGINAAIDSEVPLAQVGDDGEIFYANMSDSIPVTRFPGGGKVNPGGVCNEIEQVNFFEWEQDALSWIDKQAVGNMALFGVYNATEGKGGVYSYGRRKKDHPFVLNLEYLLDVDEIGAVITTDGVTLISYRDGSTFGVKAVDSDNKAQGIYEGLDFRAPVKPADEITTWDIVELFMDPLPHGASVQFYYKVNKTGDFIQAKTTDNQTDFEVQDMQKVTFSIAAEGEIFEPRVVLNPSGNNSPEIHRIRVYFN